MERPHRDAPSDFAVGVLLATISRDLLPEATPSSSNDRAVCVAVLAAMIGLFLLERLPPARPRAHPHPNPRARRPPPDPFSVLIVVGDGIHITVDGIATATASLANQQVGLITTLAVSPTRYPPSW